MPWRRCCARTCTLTLGILLLLSPKLSAELIYGTSSAHGISANLDIIAGTIDVDVGPVGSASGTAVPAYSETDTVASFSADGSLTILGIGLTEIVGLSTGVVTTNVSSNIDGGAGNRTTSADATVNNIDLGVDSVTSLLAIENFFELQATEIRSSAELSGQSGALSASGDATLAGIAGAGGNQASITVFGVEFLLEAAPAANTSFTIDASSHALLAGMIGSVDVFLNEQIESGDGIGNQSLLVNALRLDFNAVGVGLGPISGLLNGDVIVSQASAMAATPEPASLSMMGLFALGAGAHIRRRRRQKTAPSSEA